MVDVSSISSLLAEYGPFVALVVYIMYENSKREAKYHEREVEYIAESRKREAQFIEREGKYIEIINSISDMREDVSYIKSRIDSSTNIGGGE